MARNAAAGVYNKCETSACVRPIEKWCILTSPPVVRNRKFGSTKHQAKHRPIAFDTYPLRSSTVHPPYLFFIMNAGVQNLVISLGVMQGTARRVLHRSADCP